MLLHFWLQHDFINEEVIEYKKNMFKKIKKKQLFFFLELLVCSFIDGYGICYLHGSLHQVFCCPHTLKVQCIQSTLCIIYSVLWYILKLTVNTNNY